MTQSTSRLLLTWMGVLCACGLPAGNICQAETVFPGAAWRRATPESQGVDPAKLKKAVDFMDQEFGADGAKELVIVRNGYLIWEGPQADAYHPIWSCTKTFTSTVLGLLIDDRRCTLGTKAVEREAHLADSYPLYSRIRLRDLASMCGGYQDCNFCFVIPEWNMVVVRMGTIPISTGNIAKGDRLCDEFFRSLAAGVERSDQ